MSLMSGGEQALTAAALIFAVFLANPAPICVLDEVDAPLDDANVERFCNLLGEMRQRAPTRFITITHNPLTMSRMDRLFRDPGTGRRMRQITCHPSIHHHPFFFVPPWDRGMRRLVFVSHRTGAPQIWAGLRPHIVTVARSWSDAYGLFLKGEADMVLSYTTSPAYHIGVEKKTQYRAALFSDGHYVHVELAGMIRTTKQPELAKRFMRFVLSDEFQSLMPEGNWMMPAKAIALPASFSAVIRPEKTMLFTPEETRDHRRAFIEEWLAATAK